MIVVDLEFSGVNPNKNGIIAIGAIDFLNPENQFYEECRLDEEDKIDMPEEEMTVFEKLKLKSVKEITGLSEKKMRDPKKPFQKETLKKFFKWAVKCKVKTLAGQSIMWDYFFLLEKSRKYKIEFLFGHRTLDLHSMASLKHFQLKNRFLIKEGLSAMGLTNVMKFCGMKDERKIHNALEDAKLTAECFSRLLYGKNLFPEYERFKLPKYLIKNKLK